MLSNQQRGTAMSQQPSPEEIYRGKLIRLRIETLSKPSGGTSRYEIVEHPGGVAVVALREGSSTGPEVVLVSQQRPAIGMPLWEIPAGLVDASERDRPELTAARELREETGYIAGQWQLLTRVYLSPGFSTETSTIYLAQDAHPAPGIPPEGAPDDPSEILQIRWLPLSEALAWCQRGEIVDSKTVLGLYLTTHLFSASTSLFQV
jgi:8-oxo-dGTP pyrophosphatase MutT (NUDIX family)